MPPLVLETGERKAPIKGRERFRNTSPPGAEHVGVVVSSDRPSSVAILGGGIGGLTCALDLAKAGLAVCLYEKSDQLGGLGSSFEHDGYAVDRFYHCIMPSDAGLLALIDELGLTSKLYWRHTEMSLIWQGRHYPFCGPVDLLRFSGISLLDRLRLGATSVALPWTRWGRDLDRLSMEHWLRPLFGSSLWRRFWRPMFEAKFGDRVDQPGRSAS